MGSKNEGYFWRVDGCSTSTPARRAVISAQYSLSRIEDSYWDGAPFWTKMVDFRIFKNRAFLIPNSSFLKTCF